MRRIPKAHRFEELLQLLSLSGFAYLLYRPLLEIFVQLTELPTKEPLNLYLVATLAIAFVFHSWYFFFPIQLVLVGIVLSQYFPVAERGFSWVEAQRSQLYEAWYPFYRSQTAVFPAMVAVVLFLVLIGIGVYLLLRRKPSLLIALAIGYFLFLHTFTSYDLSVQMARALAVSFVLLGLSRIPTQYGFRALLLPLVAVSTFAGVFYFGSNWLVKETTEQQQWALDQSQSFQQWLDDRDFFKRIDEFRLDGGLKQTGFSENDQQIGGAIRQNFEEVLYIYDDKPHYWKVMNKEVFTGSGWENLTSMSSNPIIEAPTNVEEFDSIQVERQNDFDYFAYPAEGFLFSTEDQTFSIQKPSNLFSLSKGEDTSSYEVFLQPKEWQSSIDPLLDYTDEEFADLLPYLQVPGLPDDLWELSRTLVTEEMSPYEKAVRIEEYLRNEAGLRYSLRDVPPVPVGIDPISHFLFDSKVGYCDHYSSAMVILLRMNDVPARWAKGFTAGTKREMPNGFPYRVITNANAHSWPEVYLPEKGWVSFEPTPAFSSPRESETSTDEADVPFLIEEEVPTPTEEVESVVEESVVEVESDVESTPAEGEAVVTLPIIQWIGASFAVLALVVLYFKRGILARLLLLIPVDWFDWKWHMVRSLLNSSVPMKEHETYRQYGERLLQMIPYHQQAITTYVSIVESKLYGDRNSSLPTKQDQTLKDMIDVWEDLKSLRKPNTYP